jgi:hypothetical protein
MMKKRDRRKAPARPYVPAPAVEPITVEHAVEEGLLIARSALTMEVKNQIIVRALRDDRTFDPLDVAKLVARELRSFAREQEGYARRMNRLAVSVTDGPSSREHDYGPRDYRMLTQRGLIYSSLSGELARLADDAAFVADVVEAAREQAWAELGKAIEARLQWMSGATPDSDYASERDERLRSFIGTDLADLARLTAKP